MDDGLVTMPDYKTTKNGSISQRAEGVDSVTCVRPDVGGST